MAVSAIPVINHYRLPFTGNILLKRGKIKQFSSGHLPGKTGYPRLNCYDKNKFLNLKHTITTQAP